MSVFTTTMPSQAIGDAFKLLDIRMKLAKEHSKIIFCKKCLDLDITPNFAKVIIRNSTPLAQSVKHKSELLWLKMQIRESYKLKDLLKRELVPVQEQLLTVLPQQQFKCVLKDILTCVNKELKCINRRHEKKISCLQNRKNKSAGKHINHVHHFHDRIANLTQVNLTTDELNLLDKGLQYNLCPQFNRNKVKEIIAETKVVTEIGKLNKLETTKLAVKVNKLLSEQLDANPPDTKELCVLNNLNKKLVAEKAIVTKADKGNTAVIIYDTDYVTKTEEFFANNNIAEIKKDPTQSFHKRLKKKIDSTCFLFTEREKKVIKMMKTSIPQLRSQVKIHKTDKPIRPIVSNITCPTYELNKLLNKKIKDTYTFQNSYNVKNSFELAKYLSTISIPDDAKLASFDIINLYTNIPVKETLLIIKKNLLTYNKLSVGEITELMELLELSLSYNFFEFNGKIYHQKEGLAMGNSLAGTLADIFINDLENKFFNKNKHLQQNIVYYKRYVDDILFLFKGTESDIINFANSFNTMHPKIKFTTELEQNCSINYLDLTITRKNDKHHFGIYRKPTHTDTIINAHSNHPKRYKRAFFVSMIHRILRLPLHNTERNKEIDILKQIAVANGYKTKDVDIDYNRIRKQYCTNGNNNTLKPTTKKNYVSMTYNGKISQKIEQYLRKTNIKIGFQTKNSLRSRLRHTIGPKNNKFTNSGVYKIKCNDCESYYVGQTGRPFETRYKEHVSVHNKTALGMHLSTEKHSISDISNNLEILHVAPKGRYMDLLEEMEIFSRKKKAPNLILNEQQEFNQNYFFNLFEDLL